MKPNIAIVLVGGSGKRLGADRPKQFLRVRGKTIMEHTVDAFEQNENIAEIAIVSNPNFIKEVEQIVEQSSWKKVKHVLPGGKERYDSSMAALKAYQDKDVNLLLHDGVRPLVSQAIIDRVCTALEKYEAIGVALPAVDTIVEADHDCITATPDRSRLRRMQTPQAFRYKVIAEAYRRALADPAFKATDDCGVVIKYMPEIKVHLVEGEESNLKLTYKEDLPILERFFSKRETVLHPFDSKKAKELQATYLEHYRKRNLRELQLKMLDILCQTRDLLNHHKIPYWLDRETLLGAFRFGAFCPWSCHVEICLCEEHFNSFITIAKTELPQHLKVDAKVTEDICRFTECKITDVTSYIQENSGKSPFSGIYISIKPVCNYYKSPAGIIEKWGRHYIQDLQYISMPQQVSFFSTFAYAYHRIRESLTRTVWKLTQHKAKETHSMGYPLPLFHHMGNIHQVSTLFPLSTIDFEGETFSTPANENQYLTDCFGDYMHFEAEENQQKVSFYCTDLR